MNLFLKDKFINPQTIKKFFEKYPQKQEIFKAIYKQNYSDFKYYTFIRFCLSGKIDSFCTICGKQLNQSQIKNNNTHCSKQCVQQDKSIREKIEESNFKKYGCKYTFCAESVKKKIRQTNLERYGCQYASQNSQIVQKTKQTNLERYGHTCALLNDQVKQKTKQTNLERYGVENVFQNQQIKDKIKQTNLERYGSEYCLNNSQVRKKFKQTCLQRYGVQHPNQNEKIKEKTRKTNLQKYGVQNPFASEYVKQKIKQTNLQKYGVQHNMQNDKIKQKAKKTFIKKYGVDNPNKSKQVRSKTRQTNLERYGACQLSNSQIILRKRFVTFFAKILDRIKDYVVPMFELSQYNGYYKNQQYKWKCVKCGGEFYSTIHTSNFGRDSFKIPRCLNCYPYVSGFSYLQKQVVNFIGSNINYIIKEHDNLTIKPYELDIYIPQKNMAFEFDGNYWHSEKIKDSNYHLMKTQMCLQKGIQLIHIFQDQWLYQQEIAKDRIKNILGIYDNRIFARKCTIKQIPSDICNQFLDINHIQGHDNSKIRLGLFYNEELISVMTFSKPRFNRNYEYQLVRFASKLGIQVVGGASKLLKYFERNYNPKSLISYADRRYSNGKLYYALGFQFLNNSEPNYWWIKNRNKYTRYQCQKHKLKQLLGQDKFDQNLSESQNMYLNGFNKIYDCGNMVFVKQY